MKNKEESYFAGMLMLSGHDNANFMSMFADNTSCECFYGDCKSDFRTKAVPDKFYYYMYTIVSYNDTPKVKEIPSRGQTTIYEWLYGNVVTSNRSSPSSLLQTLNKVGEDPEKTYGQIVSERVFEPLFGSYQCTLAYLSSRNTSFVIGSRNSVLYVWVLYYKNSHYLIWSSDQLFIKKFKSEELEEFYCLPHYTFNSCLAINPKFLVNKVQRHLHFLVGPSSNRKLMTSQYIYNHIQKQTVQFNLEKAVQHVEN